MFYWERKYCWDYAIIAYNDVDYRRHGIRVAKGFLVSIRVVKGFLLAIRVAKGFLDAIRVAKGFLDAVRVQP